MNEEKRLEIIEQKVDHLIAIFGDLLIEADYVTKIKGLNKTTISQNKKLEKFQEIGGRKLLIKIESVPVIKQRKKTRKTPKIVKT